MKKTAIFVILAFFIVFSGFSQEVQRTYSFNWNIGNFGFSGNFPLNNDYNYEISITALNLGMESNSTNSGFEFSPFAFLMWGKYSNKEFEETNISLLNLKIYWNIISTNSIYLGPYASVNYFFMDNGIYWNKFSFSAGLHFGYRISFNGSRYNIFTMEMGYSNLNGIHKYSIKGKLDIFTFFLMYLLSD